MYCAAIFIAYNLIGHSQRLANEAKVCPSDQCADGNGGMHAGDKNTSKQRPGHVAAPCAHWAWRTHEEYCPN
jgi:hypothetical protein